MLLALILNLKICKRKKLKIPSVKWKAFLPIYQKRQVYIYLINDINEILKILRLKN